MIASSTVRSSDEAVDMAAATARGTSDACILAWPLSLERCRTLQAVQPGHHTKLSIKDRGHGDVVVAAALLSSTNRTTLWALGVHDGTSGGCSTYPLAALGTRRA